MLHTYLSLHRFMETHKNQPRIVVVDDDRNDRLYARRALERQNYCVYEAVSGRRLREILSDYKVDLILLDLKMPGEYGLNLIPVIRQNTDAPIIIVSGIQNIADKQAGLHNGADDYITKPFYAEELQARIYANLRRYKKSFPIVQTDHVFPVGSWVLDHDIADARNKAGEPQGLTIQEFHLLSKLARAGGRTLTRADLAGHSSGRGIDIHVTRIRKKLNDPALIQTIRGLGYRIPHDTLS